MVKIDPHRVTVRKRRWILLSKRLADNVMGWCYPPDSPGKQIQIEESLKGQEMLDTLLHELFHAGNWDIKEDAVEEFCTDAARILWNLGYRGVWDEE